MKPTYQVRVWPDNDWWLARVVAASDEADPAPLNAITQARSLTKIESMARDLIATILDADEDDIDVSLDYDLPDDVGELVCQAKGARAWLDAAQELWQDRSTVAAHALAEKGYSLRETATLLGLSHQRVDQLLGSHADRQPGTVWLFEAKNITNAQSPNVSRWLGAANAHPREADAVLVLRYQADTHGHFSASTYSHLGRQFEEKVTSFFGELASTIRHDPDAAELDSVDAE